MKHLVIWKDKNNNAMKYGESYIATDREDEPQGYKFYEHDNPNMLNGYGWHEDKHGLYYKFGKHRCEEIMDIKLTIVEYAKKVKGDMNG